jgi:CheY-like chemotaxis protein
LHPPAKAAVPPSLGVRSEADDDLFKTVVPPDARIRTLLYIEDNASNLRLIERLVDHRSNIQLLSAMQGGLGIELARTHHPDLILLDLQLPDMQGDQVLATLRSDPSTSTVPVIVLSADATDRQIRRLLDAGAAEYLTKPVNLARLLEVLDEHIGGTGDQRSVSLDQG